MNLWDPLGLWHWYGNWGGPGWANGEELSESDSTPLPKRGDSNYRPPIDKLDRLFEKHDRDLWNAHNLPRDNGECDSDYQQRQQDMKETAARDLADGIKNLPAQWKLYNSFVHVTISYWTFRWGPHLHGY